MKKISNIELVYDDFRQKSTSHFVLSHWENGKKITEEASPFFPYFYVPNDVVLDDEIKKHCLKIEKGFDTWDFKKAQKLTFKQVDRDTFFKIRDSFKLSYEDDVKFVMRYLIDNDIQYSKTQRLGIIDIETFKGPTSLKPLEAKEPITVIVIHDSFTKKFYIFAWSPDGTENKYTTENRQYYISRNERQMLLNFCAFLSHAKFDIFSGWNVINYDFPYIITRLKNVNIDPHKISYLGRALAFRGYNGIYLKIFGSSIVDAMVEFKKLKRLNSYSLKFVTTELLDHGKLDTVFCNSETFKENFDDLLKYCISDVDLVRELLEKYPIMQPLFALQQVVPLPLDDLQFMSRTADAFMLKKYHNKIVFPSKRKNKHVKYEGGFVAEPKAGFYDNVYYLDFKSHYLSVISAFNISPELKLKYLDEYPESAHDPEDPVFFRTDKKGLLPKIVEEIRTKREEYKTIRNTFSKNSKEWQKYDELQSAFKTLSLTFYGMFGFRSFRLFDPDVAAFITKKARELLKELINFYEERDVLVIYGDSDSIFIEARNKKEEVLAILTKFNESMIKRYKDFPPFVEVEDEFTRAIFFDKKKKYMGLRKDGTLKLTGVDPIRKDYPTYFKAKLEEFIHILLTVEKENIIPKLEILEQEILSEFKDLPLEELCEWKALSRPFDQYKVKTPHLRAAQFSNQHLDTNYGVDSRVPFLWVTGDDRTNVVALPEENPESIRKNFDWDYDRIFQKIWTKKKEMFLEVLNED